jgi:multidrug resistance efflux pump
MKRLLFVPIALAVVAALTLGVRAALAELEPQASLVPTARVTRGTVPTSIITTGELRASKSEILSAPPSGTQLRILRLATTGAAVKKGDVVVEFDPSDQEYQVEEQRSQLQEARLEIEKLEADNAAQKAQDDVDLLTARFDVRKAELDTQENELVPAIEARKNELTLEEARRRLAQLEEDVQSRAKSGAAALAVAVEKRNKAQLSIDQAQHLLGQMQLRATMDGVVAIKENRETNFFFWGMTFNEYREGDTVSSGRVVAEVLDLAQLELSAKVPEQERARLATGQVATVHLHALGSQPITAKARQVGGIAPQRMFGPTQGPVRQFDVAFTLDRISADLRPGLTADVTITGEPLKNVLFLPRQAVFERDGKPTVFVKQGSSFAAAEVKVVTRTAASVVIDRLTEGTEVALTDPTRTARGSQSAGSAVQTLGAR